MWRWGYEGVARSQQCCRAGIRLRLRLSHLLKTHPLLAYPILQILVRSKVIQVLQNKQRRSRSSVRLNRYHSRSVKRQRESQKGLPNFIWIEILFSNNFSQSHSPGIS